MKLSTDLTKPLATRHASAFAWQNWLYLPNPDLILKKLGGSVKIYRELRSDSSVGGAIRRRRAAVLSLERKLDRNGCSARIHKAVESWMDSAPMQRIISQIWECVLFGYQPIEVTWGLKDGLRLPVSVESRPPEWFVYDTENNLRFRTKSNRTEGELLPPYRYLCARQDPTYDNPYGFADLSMVFWPVAFRKGGLKFWVQFSEKYGSPWLIGKQPRGVGDAATKTFLQDLSNLVQDAVGVIPNDNSIEIIESQSKSGSSTIYSDLLKYCREEIAIGLLGQNQSTDASSTNASAQAGLLVTRDIRDGDAQIVAETINQLIQWICELNFGENTICPIFVLYEQAEVNNALAERDKKLKETGVQFSNEYFKRAYGLGDEDLVIAETNNAQSAVPKTKVASFAEATPLPAPTHFKDQNDLEKLLNANPLQGAMAEAMRPVFAAINEGKADLGARVQTAMAQFNDKSITALLERFIFVADVWARLFVQRELQDQIDFADVPSYKLLEQLFNKNPEAAIQYLKDKKYQVSWNWYEVLGNAHERVKTVARAMREDVLKVIFEALEKFPSETDFLREVTPALEAAGWWGKITEVAANGNARAVELGSPRRLQLIYQTNMAAAHSAARFDMMRQATATHPYWQWIAILDPKTRPSHRAMHGKIFGHDDELWDITRPPAGWNCRCRARPLTARRLEQNGWQPESSAGKWETTRVRYGTDLATGEVLSKDVRALRVQTVIDGEQRDLLFHPDVGFARND